MANVDAADSDPQGHGPSSSHVVSSNVSGSVSTSSDSGSHTDSYRSEGSKFVKAILSGFGRRHHTIVEDSTQRLVTKHIFSKLQVDSPEHPFFKRVWLVRHVLDEHSPIVTSSVRRQIKKNGGAWPDRLSNARDLRDALSFNQVLVSLTGVSNVSASDVYAQKIYDFVDINVGYQFVNILYRDSDGTLGVDVRNEIRCHPLSR